MAITRFQFQGCPAYLERVLGERQCEAWLWKDLVFQPSRSVKLDLSRTPTRAAAADVEVDDHTRDGGATTLGPSWPGGACSEGAVYLLQARYDAIAGKLAEPVPSGDQAFEVACQTQVVVTIERKLGAPEVVRRYHGFAAKLRHLDGDHASFDVWCHGDDLDGPGRQLWVHLSQRDQCDELELKAQERGFLALFLSYEYAGRNGLEAAKLPRGLGGGERFPKPRPPAPDEAARKKPR